MVKHEIANARVAARYEPGFDRFELAAIGNVERTKSLGAIDAMQRAIRRRRDRRHPAEFRQRDVQVAHDVTDAAHLAAGQGAVLGGEKNYGARIDDVLPSVCNAIAGRACRASQA